MFGPDMIFAIPGLLLAMTIHEYAHARVAVAMGDFTPRMTGRLAPGAKSVERTPGRPLTRSPSETAGAWGASPGLFTVTFTFGAVISSHLHVTGSEEAQLLLHG